MARLQMPFSFDIATMATQNISRRLYNTSSEWRQTIAVLTTAEHLFINSTINAASATSNLLVTIAVDSLYERQATEDDPFVVFIMNVMDALGSIRAVLSGGTIHLNKLEDHTLLCKPESRE
jgi:hypothetical protein